MSVVKERMVATVQLEELEPLLKRLKEASTLTEKLACLDEFPKVKASSGLHNILTFASDSFSLQEKIVIKSLIAIGQEALLFDGPVTIKHNLPKLKALLACLSEMEEFYKEIGGIVGYQWTILNLMKSVDKTSQEVKDEKFSKFPGPNLSKEPEEAQALAYLGIKYLHEMGMICPIGGAGDRLGLLSDHTKEPLPAALLKFCGMSLIEGLFRDVQAQEYLYYKLFGRQVVTPVALMTSQEKNNHEHLIELFEQCNWFDRPKESISFFMQPLVPVVRTDGEWVRKGIYEVALKPGGHGVMWKLAQNRGVFDWFASQGREKVLVRQINNPLAGLDLGLLAFTGYGCENRKGFGFLSCQRLVKSAEGVLVLVDRSDDKNEHQYTVSNLEYTSFAQHGVEDIPEVPGENYSLYPSNTNILFANLKVIKEALAQCSIPGMIVNLKSGVIVDGVEMRAGRLESTMQNISDSINLSFSTALSPQQIRERLQTFIVYNDRKKTISVTKNSYRPGKPIMETPEGAYYDLLENTKELLLVNCGMNVPPIGSSEEYLATGPGFICLYHPGLGPHYEVIGQKIRGGKLHPHAELQLEIAELDCQNLEVEGSLLIISENPLGKKVDGKLRYGIDCGKCTLWNVKVHNRGTDKKQKLPWWRNEPYRHESMTILLKGNAEFFAQNIVFEGHQSIVVPDGHRMIAQMKGNDVDFHLEPIHSPSWRWHYSFNGHYHLHRQSLQ